MPVEALDAVQHNRNDFRCGNERVDRYFQRLARQAADRFAAQTYVLVPAPPRPTPCEVFGYYTFVQHAYRDSEMDPTTARALHVKNLGTIPTILLGQLGVSSAHQGKGVGSALLRDALRRALHVALSIGAVAVITDPIDDAAAAFYRKYGFRPLPKQEPRLLIPTSQLARYNHDIVSAFKNRSSTIEIPYGPQNFSA